MEIIDPARRSLPSVRRIPSIAEIFGFGVGAFFAIQTIVLTLLLVFAFRAGLLLTWGFSALMSYWMLGGALRAVASRNSATTSVTHPRQ